MEIVECQLCYNNKLINNFNNIELYRTNNCKLPHDFIS